MPGKIIRVQENLTSYPETSGIFFCLVCDSFEMIIFFKTPSTEKYLTLSWESFFANWERKCWSNHQGAEESGKLFWDWWRLSGMIFLSCLRKDYIFQTTSSGKIYSVLLWLSSVPDTRTCPPARVWVGGHKDFDLKPKPEVNRHNPQTKSMNLFATSTSTVLKTT